MWDIFQKFVQNFSLIIPLPFTVSVDRRMLSIIKLTRFQRNKVILFYVLFHLHIIFCLSGFLYTILSHKIEKHDMKNILETFLICFDILIGSPFIGMSYVLCFMPENLGNSIKVISHLPGNKFSGKLLKFHFSALITLKSQIKDKSLLDSSL